ncbi:putative TIM-barrel fold metal-dependent hydrolase [Paraburkholderia sp. GAS334]
MGNDGLRPTEKYQKPGNAHLFDLLLTWAPDEAMRHRILVGNPAVLYGFPST